MWQALLIASRRLARLVVGRGMARLRAEFAKARGSVAHSSARLATEGGSAGVGGVEEAVRWAAKTVRVWEKPKEQRRSAG